MTLDSDPGPQTAAAMAEEGLALEVVDLRATVRVLVDRLAHEATERWRYQQVAKGYLYQWICADARCTELQRQITRLMEIEEADAETPTQSV